MDRYKAEKNSVRQSVFVGANKIIVATEFVLTKSKYAQKCQADKVCCPCVRKIPKQLIQNDRQTNNQPHVKPGENQNAGTDILNNKACT